MEIELNGNTAAQASTTSTTTVSCEDVIADVASRIIELVDPKLMRMRLQGITSGGITEFAYELYETLLDEEKSDKQLLALVCSLHGKTSRRRPESKLHNMHLSALREGIHFIALATEKFPEAMPERRIPMYRRYLKVVQASRPQTTDEVTSVQSVPTKDKICAIEFKAALV